MSEAWIHTALGDRDAALAVLERSEEDRQIVSMLLGLPPFDPLRGEPRFQAVLARMGLDAAS